MDKERKKKALDVVENVVENIVENVEENVEENQTAKVR